MVWPIVSPVVECNVAKASLAHILALLLVKHGNGYDVLEVASL